MMEAYVNVWNCKPEVVINGKSENELNLSEAQKRALEKLKEYVVYTVNNGALNWSGQYPFDDFSLDLLKEILEGKTDVVQQIEKPTDKDFEEKAKELIEELEEGDWQTVYSSALAYGCADGCRGYHYEEYVTKKNGELVLFDNGQAHHALCLKPERKTIVLSKEDAIQKLKEYLSALAERYDWTKRELEDFELESLSTGIKLEYCDRHDFFFFNYEEECPYCAVNNA